MKKYRKIISIITAAAVAIPALGHGSIPISTQEAQETKQYVIIAETNEAYEAAVEEAGDNVTEDTSLLLENNVMVAELTEKEAAALEADDILVEEDIVLTASTAGEEMTELPVEEARKRKEEIKRKKAERYQKMAEEARSQAEAGNQEEAEPEWNLQAIGAEDLENGDTKVKVAVLDSGVDYVEGIELDGYVNLVEEEDYVVPAYQDLTGHGTGIAGIIAGDGTDGFYGVNPNAGLYSVKVLGEENTAPLSRIIRGIYWCMENDMDIINMSFGTSVYSRALEQAVTDAYEAGLLMVGAAGNNGSSVEYPAAFPEVMAVAATGTDAQLSDFSNAGDELDIAAPGEKIRVASFFGGSTVTHGTSIAVPHVTGVASLLWEKDRTKSNEFIRQLISSSAKAIEGTDDCGLLDAQYALDCYGAFAESFDETKNLLREELPENTDEPEVFDEVDTDEAYVEGLWRGSDHKAAVDTYAGSYLTASAIAVVKLGAVFPDKDGRSWKGAKKNPR